MAETTSLKKRGGGGSAAAGSSGAQHAGGGSSARSNGVKGGEKEIKPAEWEACDEGPARRNSIEIPLGQPVFSTNDRKTAGVALLLVTLAAILTRFYRIGHPAEVVFDEVHFGKFAAYYLRREYFFDVHPPFAKLLNALAGWFVGFDGRFEFENIGDSYIKNGVPYVGMRCLSAILGTITVPLVFLIMRESGYPAITCVLATSLVLFDNAHIAQSRLILLDAALIFFMACSMYTYIRFYKLRYQEFSLEWWSWLVLTGASLSLTISCKGVGLFTFFTIGVAVLVDLWNLLDIERGLSIDDFLAHFLARSFGLIIVPAIVYVFWFWVHFTILIKSGPGDAFMSPEFQETLTGNILLTQAHDVRWFDTVEIKHKDTGVYLHSHLDRYPLRYDDGRVSSQGQQVTGYPYNDTNNFWELIPTTEQVLALTIDPEGLFPAIKHGEVVRLRHVMTRSHLLTHDVASPLMPTNQEFSTWPMTDESRYNDTLFELQLNDGESDMNWKTKRSYFKLVHLPTKVALWTYPDGVLPEWAFKQQEINGNKNTKDKSNLWYVDQIHKVTVDNETGQVSIFDRPLDAEELKEKPLRKIAFIKKFFELQSLMLRHNAGLTQSHPYASPAQDWPLLRRGVSYWTNNENRQQNYFIGNPASWWACTGALAIFVGLVLADLIGRRRGRRRLGVLTRKRFYNNTGFFFISWLMHYSPFFTMSRQLFLHHYLPAHLASALCTASIFHFVTTKAYNGPLSSYGPVLVPPRSRMRTARTRTESTRLAKLIVAIFSGAMIALLVFLAPLTYGTPGLTVSGVLQRKLLSTWDLQFAK